MQALLLFLIFPALSFSLFLEPEPALQEKTCRIQNDHDIISVDLAIHLNNDLSECCRLCSQNEQCQAFVWSHYQESGNGLQNNGTCKLKGEFEKGQLTAKVGVIIGHLHNPDDDNLLVSWKEFSTALELTNYTEPTVSQYKSYLQGLPHGLIHTKEEAAMALTHFIWESDGLIAKREYKCLDTGCPGHYETPGCDVEGQDYYGRGYIQLTWCYNYKPASYAIFGDDRLVENPDFVAQDEETAWNTAFWFWGENVHSRHGVAEGKFGVTTRAINGGWECAGPNKHVAKHRYEMYKQVRAAFGLDGEGDERGCYN